MPSKMTKPLGYSGKKSTMEVSRGYSSGEKKRKDFEEEKVKETKSITYSLIAHDLKKIRRIIRGGVSAAHRLGRRINAPKRASKLAGEYAERERVIRDLAQKHRSPHLSSVAATAGRRSKKARAAADEMKRKRKSAKTLAGSGVTAYGVGEIDL